MDRDMLNMFQKQFETERAKLVFSQGFESENFHLAKDDMLDELDMTSSEMATGMRTRLRNRETLYLKKIEQALKRISDGTFGECKTCQEPVETKRLQARPTTTLCVGCKEDQEHRELLHIDGHKPKSMGRPLRLA